MNVSNTWPTFYLSLLTDSTSCCTPVFTSQAAAALLALFHQLPRSFMPPSVTAICTRCVPTRAAALSMLQDDMSRLELAVLGQALALFKGALAPEAVSHNGLTPAALAAALCDYWFTGGGAGGCGL